MANGTIDSLSIEIGASSNNAVNNVNKLVDAMKALKTATAGIDSGAVGKLRDLSSALKTLGEAKNINISSKLGQNIGALAGAMKAVKSEDISKLRQVASAIKTLDGTKSISINSKLAQNIVDIAAAVEMLEKTHFDKITQFGNALKALGGNSININKNLAERLKEIAAAVDTISTDTLDKIRQLTKALARLKGMGDVKIRISGVGSASAGGNKGNNPLPGGAQNSGQQNSGGSSGSGQTGNNKQIQWTLSLKKNISLIAAEWSKVGQAISSAIPGPLKLVLSIVGGIAKAVWNVAKGIAKWAFNTALSVVKRIASAVKSIAKGVVDVGKNLVKNWYDRSIFKSLADEFERIRSILSTFGRIAFYRAVRSAIKYVTDALQQGTENAYWFSKKFGEATKYISEAYDQMSSSSFKMSNQLGAAWSTLIATIEPIIIQIINLVTKAAEAVTQFFAVLGGKTIYMKAIDYSKDWADETEKGSKAAKEWKNQLMGFDEINRLEAPSDNDTSGKTDKYKDYENMFEEADVDGIFKKIKDMINSGQWAGLGTMLGEKFNGLINKFDWSGWGAKIGRGIQHGIDLAYNFLNTADFKNLGGKIAEFFNRMGDEINFEQLGRTVRKIKLVLWNILYGAITGLEWDKWAIRISDYIIGSLNELADWIETLDPKAIAKAIKDFFGNIKYEEIRDSFVKVVKLAWEKTVELKEELFPEGLIPVVTKAITDWIDKFDWETIRATISENFQKAWSFVSTQFDKIWPPEDREAFFKVVIGWFVDIGKGIGEALWEGFKETQIGKILTTIFDISSAVLNFTEPTHMLFNAAGILGDFWESLSSTIGSMKDDSVTSIGDVETKGTEMSGAMEEVKTSVTKSYDEISTSATNTSDAVKTSTDNMGSNVTNLKNTCETESQNISNSASNVSGAISEMSGLSISAVSQMTNTTINKSHSIINAFNNIISKAKEAWNWVNKVGTQSQSLPNGRSYTYKANKPGVFASGGFPEDGLFYANHGEMVGKFSNGKTAVANNDQITSGIAEAVYGAFVRAFAETGGGDNGGTKVAVFNVNGREFARATFEDNRAVAREHGMSLINSLA